MALKLYVDKIQIPDRRNKFSQAQKRSTMNKLVRGLIAGYGAKKLGGGCLGTIVVFFIIWYALQGC
jgi:hypothetical protein